MERRNRFMKQLTLALTLALTLTSCGTERETNTVIPADNDKTTTCWEEVKCHKVRYRGQKKVVCQTFDICEEKTKKPSL